MKKTLLLPIALTIFMSLIHITYAADSSEKVSVVKFNRAKSDLVVERAGGERLLIQHNRLCSSMDIDFPVYLLWTGEKVTQLKIAVNEICKVYNFGPYNDDIIITKRIKSPTSLIKDHLAEVEWKDRKYQIDYGDGCENLRNHINEDSYLHTLDSTLKGATLYLPGNRGQCTINSATLLSGDEPDEETALQSPIKNLQYKAENNEAYFYWDPDTSDQEWVYLIANSRRKIDPADYHYRQMPNLRFSFTNEYTAKTLANNTTYYFYFSARNYEGDIAPWTEIEVTPVITRNVIVNNPDPEPFEIMLSEDTESSFLLTWPDKSEGSRRYLIQFFVDGKRQFLKIIDGALKEYSIKKEPEYAGKGFRFTLRSIPKDRFGARYSDGIFWEDETN